MSYNTRGGGRGGRGGAGGRGGQGGGRGGYGSGNEVKIFSPNTPSTPPSTTVTKIEDAVLSNRVGLQLGKLGLKDSLPLREGYGTVGRVITLWANYVEMVASEDLTLYRYDMTVSPAVIGRKHGQVIRQLLRTPELAQFQQDIVTDFKSTLISRSKLGGNEITIPITYHDERFEEPREDAPVYKVRLVYTNTLSIGNLINHLQSTDASAPSPDKDSTIQALNIFLNHHSKQSNSLPLSLAEPPAVARDDHDLSHAYSSVFDL